MKLETRGREHGSMFILVLMVLLIVTFIGLSLVFVTETEMQLGGVDKVLTTTFYTAESGIHAAVRGVSHQNWEGESVAFEEGQMGPDPDIVIGTRFTTTRIHVVGTPQAPPMSIANENENKYGSYSLVLKSTAQRISWPNASGNEVPIYDDGDPAEDDVTIQSSRDVTIRLFISPVSHPTSGIVVYDDATPLEF